MKRGFRSKVSFVNYPNVCMPHFSVRVLDKMAAKTTAVPHPFYSPRAKQHFDTRRLSGIGICWNGKRNSVSARVRKRKKENKKKKKEKKKKSAVRGRFLPLTFFDRGTSPSGMKNRKREKDKKRKIAGERKREREREREEAGGSTQRNCSSERFCLPTRTFNEKDRFSESVIRIACFCPIPMSWRALENFARAGVETGSS